MKKYKCPICGDNTLPLDDKNNYCNNCLSVIDLELINKSNKIKVLKNNILIYLTNREYNKAITFLSDTYNNLLLEYYKLFSYTCINKEYDINKLYNEQLEYTQEELDIIINHIFENYKLLSFIDISYFISKCDNKNKYLDILNNINNHESDKIKEKEFREILFHKTKVPFASKYDSRKREGFSLLIIALILNVVFNVLVVIISLILKNSLGGWNSKISLYLGIVGSYVPCIPFTKGLTKLIFKKNNLLISLLFYIGSVYIYTFMFDLTMTSLINSISLEDFSIKFLIDHFINIINSPIKLIMELVKNMEWSGV